MATSSDITIQEEEILLREDRPQVQTKTKRVETDKKNGKEKKAEKARSQTGARRTGRVRMEKRGKKQARGGGESSSRRKEKERGSKKEVARKES